MKCLQRYLCVLLCFVSLLGVFSVSVSAKELEKVPYTVEESSYFYRAGYNIYLLKENSYKPSDNVTSYGSTTYDIPSYVLRDPTYNAMGCKYWYIHNDNGVLAEKDVKTTFKFERVYYTYLIQSVNVGTLSYYDYNPDYADIVLHYANGTTERWRAEVENTANTFYYTLKASGTPKDEVVGVTWNIQSQFKDDAGYTEPNSDFTVRITSYWGYRAIGDNEFTVIQPSEEETLLGGIWDSLTSGFNALGEKLTGVWTAITDGFTNMGNKLTDVWNSIKELPGKLWALIEEGLTNLFVPSEESMEEFKTKFETMLEQKYGAVWEVVQITFGSWENINASDLKNTISVPKVEIPLPDDNSFSFGGKEVKVIPAGFETIADICKMMSGAFCTLMFINGLRKRYDEVMAVEK